MKTAKRSWPTAKLDGGAFDWLGKLTSNRRLAFVASGMGAQLAAYLFRVER